MKVKFSLKASLLVIRERLSLNLHEFFFLRKFLPAKFSPFKVVPSLPLVDDFVVQWKLAVSLCQLTSSKEESSWEYSCYVFTRSESYTNI